ncbi:unnamed protein product [Ectocarpus sp. 12 AP-2014]
MAKSDNAVAKGQKSVAESLDEVCVQQGECLFCVTIVFSGGSCRGDFSGQAY